MIGGEEYTNFIFTDNLSNKEDEIVWAYFIFVFILLPISISYIIVLI